jgi:putative copper resistance protein D
VTTIGPWDAAAVIAKAITYAATLAAAGGIFFLSYSHALIREEDGVRLRRFLRALAVIAVAAGAVRILATAASMTGAASGLYDLGLARMILGVGEGRANLVRLLGLIAAIAGLRRHAPPSVIALLGAAAAATSFAWVGHVPALAGAKWPILVLAVHLLSVAFWLGALWPLLSIARNAEAARVAAAAARFGAAAVWVVGVLLSAGACLLGVLLRDVTELWTQDYGRLVLGKMLLVACVLALAAVNRLRLTPRLFAYDAGALKALKISIGAEIAVAGGILLVTAALTTLTGPEGLDASH